MKHTEKTCKRRATAEKSIFNVVVYFIVFYFSPVPVGEGAGHSGGCVVPLGDSGIVEFCLLIPSTFRSEKKSTPVCLPPHVSAVWQQSGAPE